MNGNIESRPTSSHKSLRDYKMIIDPCLVKGGIKLYRYEGIVANDPKYPPVIPRDPRNQLASRIRSRLEPHDIPVPR